MVEASVLKEVPREVNGEEITLSSHTGHMPECNIRFTDDELTAAEHDAIYTWGQRGILFKIDYLMAQYLVLLNNQTYNNNKKHSNAFIVAINRNLSIFSLLYMVQNWKGR